MITRKLYSILLIFIAASSITNAKTISEFDSSCYYALKVVEKDLDEELFHNLRYFTCEIGYEKREIILYLQPNELSFGGIEYIISMEDHKILKRQHER